jgi:acetyl-CoA C-acetyltransferase
MPDAVIVSTARTPIGKAYRGAFNMTHGADLGGHVVRNAVARSGVEPGEVEDVILGCALPERATGGNIARQAAIRAGLPVTVGGMTVNRFCSSGLQTIALAAQRIISGEASVIAAGGLESISLVQDGKSLSAPSEWMSATRSAARRRTPTRWKASAVPRRVSRPSASTARSCRSRPPKRSSTRTLRPKASNR